LTFDLVGVGNPVYDIIESPVAKTRGRVLSGCSTNACLAARKLGMSKVGLIGAVGKDYLDTFLSDMKRYGIATELNATSPETGGFRLIYDTSGDRTLEVLGVAQRITSKNIPENFLDAKYVLLGPILGEVDLELVQFLKSSSNCKLFLDPQGLVRVVQENGKVIHNCDRSSFRKVAELVDFIKPNEPESQTITRAKDPIDALRHLRGFGTPVCMITLAERGSLVLENSEFYRIPAYRTNAVDPTGAGDVYAGAFLVNYSGARNLVDSALFASAAASIMVEQIGPDFQMAVENVMKRKDLIRGRVLAERFA